MKIDRFILCQYCDDVRGEVDGKISLIGVYSGGLMVNIPLPVTVPKLWVVCHVGTPPDQPFANAVLRVQHDDHELLRTNVPDQVIEESTHSFGENPARRGFMLTLAFQLPSFEIKKDGAISVFVDTNGETLNANRLVIKTLSSHPASSPSA